MRPKEIDVSNPLKESGLPYFFKVSNPEALGINKLPIRKGDAIRTCVRSLNHMQKEAFVRSSRTNIIWRLASDEGKYLMGKDECPAPLAFLTTGMVSSYMNEIIALAKLRSIPIQDITLIQDNYYGMTGSMRKRTIIGSAFPIDLEAQIVSTASQKDLQKLVYDAAAASPLNGLLSREHHSLFKLAHNGKELPPKEVEEIKNVAVHDDVSISFDKAIPALKELDEPILLKKGMSPILEAGPSSEGSSLKETQQRKLHLRGICKLRPDGVKEIEQQLFNPHGSVFRFLSEEAPENGGKGRAPDANSYISAGIGFCFMTQFGRYATMMKSDLQRYGIIQDTHFSLGGASGNTGQMGSADPVETHVFLYSNEDDEFAKEILYMSERTCFLHALCRTDLKPRIRVKKV